MADQQDIQAHTATYAGIIALLKWGAVGAFVIALLVIWLIAPAGK